MPPPAVASAMYPNPQPDPTPRSMGAALALVLGAAIIVGFLIGIVPGVVLGLFDMQFVGAIVGAVAWGAWQFYARWRRTGRMSMVVVAMAVAGALGVFVSVLLFGSLTREGMA